MDFAKLRKFSSSNLEKLSKAVEAMNAGSSNREDTESFWKCELDKSGNGFAILRFLPIGKKDSTSEQALPWVKYYDHGFQGPGGWYIEKSLTTLGLEDPCGLRNSELWETGIESNKEICRKQKRRLHYVSNIYIIKDTKHPENEGKVFKYTYGKKIFEKITQAMNPQFEDDRPINPFDFWTGANFKLKVRKVDGYQNYDLAEFDSPSALFDDDSKLEAIWNEEYSLSEIIDPKNFKSYAELESRLKRVLGQTVQAKYKTAEDYTAQSMESIADKAFIKEKVEKAETSSKAIIDDESEDSDLDYFARLVGED